MDASRHRFGRFALVLVLLLSVAATIYFYLRAGGLKHFQHSPGNEGGPPYFVEAAMADASEATDVDQEIICSRNNAIVKSVQKVGPGVVSISTVQMEIVPDPWFDPFFPFIPGRKRANYGLGSGFIIDKRGYIVTNQHVIEDADSIKVALPSGEEFEARIIGADYESDLAVLKVDTKLELPIVELGDSSDLMVGEWAIAIGNPFGFLLRDSVPSVSLGVISATGRAIQEKVRTFNDLIQTDATINPGNSGGPLVNCFGQVIGINIAIFSTSGGSQGVGFAIPINTAKRVINELIQHGVVMEPWIGVEYQELTGDIAEHLGSPVNEGLLISHIVEDSPAEEAGLMRGDIVVKIGDRAVRTLDEASAASSSLKSGQEVVFRIVRDGDFRNVVLKVGATETAEIARAWFGLVVQKPTPEAARKYELSSYRRGVLVIRVDRESSADRAGLKRGDLILSMSREKTGIFRNLDRSKEIEIKTIDDFRKFVSGIPQGQRIQIILERKGELWRASLTAVKD